MLASSFPPKDRYVGWPGLASRGSHIYSLAFPAHPSWHDKYVVSILVFADIQCDGAWWFPLTGCHGYPVQSALLVLRLHLLQAPFPMLIYC